MLAATSLKSTGRSYHVYVSYAHVDWREHNRVQRIVERLRTSFENKTKQPLLVFVDRVELRAGTMWEPELFSAMRGSTVMLAMLSPAYFKSDMCCKEWDYFVALEQSRRGSLPANQGLIFGVKLGDWSGLLSEHEARRRQDAQARQYYDVGNDELTEAREIDKLVTNLIGLLECMPPAEAELKHDTHVYAKVGADLTTFIERLAGASAVTIVGITHYRLADYLERALALKRSRSEPNAFWEKIQIVFLHESLLHAVRDELSRELAHDRDALARRRFMAQRGARAVQRFFVRANRPNAWQVLEYEGLLPFLGTHFVNPDREEAVQIGVLRPGFATADYVFLEFSSRNSPIEVNYYAETISEIAQRSTRSDEIILTGAAPVRDGERFRLQRAVARRTALLPGASPGTSVPVVLMLLWATTSGEGPIALLQVRTDENRTRELETLSNVSGYIQLRDCPQFRLGDDAGVDLDDAVARSAISRELREELGIAEQRMTAPTFWGGLPLIQPAHQNIYALVYSLQLEADGVDERVRLAPHAFQELLDVRLYHVVSKIQHVLGLPRSTARTHSIEALQNNLILHDRADLAADLGRYSAAPETTRKRFERKLQKIQKDTRRTFDYRGEERIIRGLPRMQYREFFGLFLQVYAQLGIPGAEECLARVTLDENAVKAASMLRRYYRSVLSMREDPAEQHS